jgi:hypothetical protein
MRRIVAGIFVVVLTLVAPPAAAQNGSVWLTPASPEPVEDAGEVVLTISLWRAGRVAYRTYDGACTVTYSAGGTPPDAACWGDKASASKDYAATSGELVFTEVEGSKTIKIPILDDDLAEWDETFTFAAWEEVNADPWIDRGDSVIVHIIDDEADNTGEPAATAARTNTTAAHGRPSRSPTVVTLPPKGTPAADVPSPAVDVARAAGELRPGAGFELTSDDPSGQAPARQGGGGGPEAAWLAPGLGTAATGVGALAFLRRRRQWSPTRP